MAGGESGVDDLVAEWRRAAGADASGEEELRALTAELAESGLSVGEAFLVAVGRMGERDAASREFARGYAQRLYGRGAEPGAAPDAAPQDSARAERREFGAALLLAAAAGAIVAIPNVFDPIGDDAWYYRNAVVVILGLLAGYFAWKRALRGVRLLWLAAPFAVALVFANAYPYSFGGSDSGNLAFLHLPIALWVAVGAAYAGSRWRETGTRIAFVRFSGGWFVAYVLIALGGGALVGVTQGMFAAIDVDAEYFLFSWVVPSGAAGAVLITAWLVETWGKTIEQAAPMLARVFTPLVAAALLAFLAAMAWTGRGVGADRDVLIAFDLLLALVLGLLIYVVASRDPNAPPSAFDWLAAALVVSALVVDAAALAGIASRISDFGFSPNKTAALGENLVILANLGWSAWLYGRFLLRRGSFRALERWQTAYLPVYGAWAAVVVIVFPPLFDYA